MSAERSAVLDTALNTFRRKGYADATLEEIAHAAQVDLAALQAQYPDKETLLNALLKVYNPADDFEAAINAVQGEHAEDMLRDVMRRMVEAAQKHDAYFELALIDSQVNNGSSLVALSTRLVPQANALLQRIKGTDELRPVSDLIIARTLISLLMGFIVSERAMPQIARMALRMFPQRAWIDGMVDLLLYGLLEDDVR